LASTGDGVLDEPHLCLLHRGVSAEMKAKLNPDLTRGLVIVETHPVQYHAPVWRAAAKLGVPLKVVYGGDFSVRGYRDREFGASFRWEADLLAGYPSQVLQPEADGYDAVTAYGLENALDQINPAALLALGYHHPLDRAAIRWALKRNVPLFFRGETSDAPRAARSWWRALLRDLLLRRLYRRCTAVLYLGENSRSHYRRLGVPEDKLVHAPYCVDTSMFETGEQARALLRMQTRIQAGIAEDAWVLLFSGKLSWRKGVDLIPQAAALLPEHLRRRLHLVFAGDGEKRAELEVACASSAGIPAHFAGFVNQSGLSAWYHASDALLLPSREMETWGLVVNDALHHGLPVVVSEAVGCAPDLVLPGRTGEVCAADDACELAEALERCAAWNDGTKSVRDRCRERVGGYMVQQAAEGLHEVWKRLHSSPGTGEIP
jgi:glycosyltransferase involved in cell wall biosynthesis